MAAIRTHSTTATTTAQLFSIATALLTSGGIASLTFFDVPLLTSQPASRSLPLIRWLFSRGSHIFPSAAIASAAGFVYLAYEALPPGERSMLTLASELVDGGNGVQVNAYLAAAALVAGIAPWTGLMLRTNFELIEKNERLGGARSEESAGASARKSAGGAKPDAGWARSAMQSVQGQGQPNEFMDLSGPQMEVAHGERVTEADEERVRLLLGRFGSLNLARAGLAGLGGVVGLWAALR